NGLPARVLIIGKTARHQLALHVPALSSEIARAEAALAECEHGQQRPKTIPAFQIERRFGMTAEEASKDRLHDVFRTDLLSEAIVESAACEADQAVSIAMEELLGGVGFAVVQAGHEGLYAWVVAHGSCHDGADITTRIQGVSRISCQVLALAARR